MSSLAARALARTPVHGVPTPEQKQLHRLCRDNRDLVDECSRLRSELDAKQLEAEDIMLKLAAQFQSKLCTETAELREARDELQRQLTESQQQLAASQSRIVELEGAVNEQSSTAAVNSAMIETVVTPHKQIRHASPHPATPSSLAGHIGAPLCNVRVVLRIGVLPPATFLTRTIACLIANQRASSSIGLGSARTANGCDCMPDLSSAQLCIVATLTAFRRPCFTIMCRK